MWNEIKRQIINVPRKSSFDIYSNLIIMFCKEDYRKTIMIREELYNKGISDIVETEGNLPRFTKICQELHQRKLYSWNEIVPLVKKVTGFTRHSPIQRHIQIFKKIGILNQRGSMYTLSSEGRALIEITKDKTSDEILTLSEKIFYFRTIFNNAFYQLFILLQTIDERQELASLKELIVDYFNRIINSPFRVWKKESLRRDIEIYGSKGNLQRGLRNKFGCMRTWLKHLELLERKNIILSSLGKEILRNIKSNRNDLSERIYGMANIYINGKVDTLPHFNYLNNNHKLSAIELFKLAYSLFERHELRMSDAKSMKYFICNKILVNRQITMEKNSFDRFLHQLQREGQIRSIIPNDMGKIAYISR